MTLGTEQADTGLPQSAADAVENLYRTHAVGLVRFAMVLLGDRTAAEDVVQEAFTNLFRRWYRLADHGNIVAYLRMAVLNGCRSALRSQGRARRLRAPHDPPAWSAEAQAMDTEDRRALLIAVSQLPRRQREVVVLKYYLDMGEREIGSLLRISRGGCVVNGGPRAGQSNPAASGGAVNDVNEVEEGLRDVFRAVAQSLSPEEIRPLRIRHEVPGYGRWRRPLDDRSMPGTRARIGCSGF